MKRSAGIVAMVIAATATLSGCGGGSEYCDTVAKDTSSLNTFGQKRTNAAYAGYAKVLSDIAKVAPAPIKKDWTALSTATMGIIDAQKDSGIALEDMKDPAKLKKVDPSGLKKLNKAYEAFNATTKQRNAVVKNVLQECDIKLK